MIFVANKTVGRHIHQEGCTLTLDEELNKEWGPYEQLRPLDALLLNVLPCSCLPHGFIEVYEQARRAVRALKEYGATDGCTS